MNQQLSPQRAANEISAVLKTVFGANRFPVDVETVAQEISQRKYPDDAITKIVGDDLPGFEGALIPSRQSGKGWLIAYNNTISPQGRINFTLGHEFGHYILHRAAYPKGFQCTTEDMTNWHSEYRRLEQQANVFAATLLMPFDDFRNQISAHAQPTFDELGICAERYAVSLTAVTLRWLEYTARPAVLVVSRDGFILWARSSKRALKAGLYYKTRNCPPVEIPPASLAAGLSAADTHIQVTDHDRNVWLGQPCREQALVSGHYDFTMSLLYFDDASVPAKHEDTDVEDAYDHMVNRTLGQSWLG